MERPGSNIIALILEIIFISLALCFLLVTSNYHTARARRIYLSAEHERGGGPDLRVVASGDQFFAAGNWWHNREGRKTVFMEWTKTLTSVFGI